MTVFTRRNNCKVEIKKLSLEMILVLTLMFELPIGRADLQDVILSPHPRTPSGKYVYFHPKTSSGKNKIIETSTKVPWEEPLKESVNIALGSSKISKTSLLKAPYIGFINLNSPTFGDISVLAKGKLKKNANKTFSFEQVNDRCDEKCQINADKYLENVTALWMVERIRHRDGSDENHHFDLKFTVVPIYGDTKHQIDHNILENRLKNQMKKTFILRDSDYPNYFHGNANRRSDFFSSGFERGMSSIMNFNPNSLMQSLFGANPPAKQKSQSVDNRLNKGEFYMSPKIQNSPKTTFSPSINGHASHVIDHRVRFPDSKEFTTMVNKPLMNLYRHKPEIYHKKNIIDYRGANDNVFVGSSDHRQMQPSYQQPPNFHSHPNYQQNFPQGFNQQNFPHGINQQNFPHGVNQKLSYQQQNQQIAVPIFSIPVDVPIIQLAQSPYAFPLQLQLSTPANQALFPPNDVTTFRYQPLIGLSNHQSAPLFNSYLPISLLPTTDKSKPFKESERHVTNYYSPPDPVYHHGEQSTTEAPIQPSTYSPRVNNYASIVRQQVEKPVISTASSIQVNRFDDNEFVPISPSYDARKFKNVPKTSSTAKPDSINAQLVGIYDDVNATIPYVTLPPLDDTSVKSNEISYKVVLDRPKSSTKPSEKPVLKWVPKKQRTKGRNFTSTTPFTPTQNSFLPTALPIETTTQQSIKSTTFIYRGRNRYNKRNSSSSANVRAATISPQTTKLAWKKTTSAAAISTLSTPSPYPSSVFPAYITPQATEEPITSQSFSTSVSLEVNGERIFNPTTTVGYELIPAGVESINTNTSNIKLFKASVVPEKFDELTFSILNHAKVIEGDKKAN